MKLLVLYGTRPEAIKLAPVILEAKKRKLVDLFICNTGQHREMTQEAEDVFGFCPDFSLKIMRPDQSLNHIISSIASQLDSLLYKLKPDIVMIQGDTSSVLAASICCFNLNIAVAHVEAGLRSSNLASPFPEEYNRRVVSLAAMFNFAPTKGAMKNLLAEGIPMERICVTGNTVVDATEIIKSEINKGERKQKSDKKKILVTAHRRENHKHGIDEIIKAANAVVRERSDVEIVWPVHPNPNVKLKVFNALNGIKRIKLMPPLGYKDLIRELMECYIIWTDSGGIQEEAPTFRKPVLILRDTTERPEIISSGFGVLTHARAGSILDHTHRLLDHKFEYDQMISGSNPFGDGRAAANIVDFLIKSWNANPDTFSE